MAIGNLHRMTPEDRAKALGEKPEEVAVKPEETKPEKKRK